MAIKISELANLTAYTDSVFIPVVETAGNTFSTVKSTSSELKTYVLGTIPSEISDLTANTTAQATAIYNAEVAIVTANIGQIGYTDNKVLTANIGQIGYTDNKVTTANIGIKGYTDFANTVQDSVITSRVNTANIGQIGYTNNTVLTANIGQIGYTDNKVLTANIGQIGYTDNKVTTANVAMKGYVDSGDSKVTLQHYLPTANLAITANVHTTHVLITPTPAVPPVSFWADVKLPNANVDGTVISISSNVAVETFRVLSPWVSVTAPESNIALVTDTKVSYVYSSTVSEWFRIS